MRFLTKRTFDVQEWKKKYCCLYEDGRFVYHNNVKEYMENTVGKEVDLKLCTIKLPNRNPHGVHRPAPSQTSAQGKFEHEDGVNAMYFPFKNTFHCRSEFAAAM